MHCVGARTFQNYETSKLCTLENLSLLAGCPVLDRAWGFRLFSLSGILGIQEEKKRSLCGAVVYRFLVVLSAGILLHSKYGTRSPGRFSAFFDGFFLEGVREKPFLTIETLYVCKLASHPHAQEKFSISSLPVTGVRFLYCVVCFVLTLVLSVSLQFLSREV